MLLRENQPLKNQIWLVLVAVCETAIDIKSTKQLLSSRAQY
jgi:hypothetical protein